MRTTLTLDADVSIELETLRRQQGLSLKDAVNNALRRGLRAMAEGD
jgi:Arc/MetJ family transcription regulator